MIKEKIVNTFQTEKHQKKSSDEIKLEIEEITNKLKIFKPESDEGEKLPPPEDKNVWKAADKVCREFDYIGLLDRTKMVDSKLVDQFYSLPFVKLYKDILENFVDELRKENNRGPTHYWELVMFYDRVKNVPENHPGKTRKGYWPRYPRKKLL